MVDKDLKRFAARVREERERFGVAVVEAMACGLPVLVSDAGGLPEVVEHGVSGWVVPRGDVRALADALVRLATDRPLRQRLERAARERVLTTYAWEACVDRMLACQDAAIESRLTT